MGLSLQIECTHEVQERFSCDVNFVLIHLCTTGYMVMMPQTQNRRINPMRHSISLTCPLISNYLNKIWFSAWFNPIAINFKSIKIYSIGCYIKNITFSSFFANFPATSSRKSTTSSRRKSSGSIPNEKVKNILCKCF